MFVLNQSNNKMALLYDFTDTGLVKTSLGNLVVDIMIDDENLKQILYRTEEGVSFPLQNLSNLFLFIMYNDFATVGVESRSIDSKLHGQYTLELKECMNNLFQRFKTGDILKFSKDWNGNIFIVRNEKEMITGTNGTHIRIPMEIIKKVENPVEYYREILESVEYFEMETEPKGHIMEFMEIEPGPCIQAWSYGKEPKEEVAFENEEIYSIFGSISLEDMLRRRLGTQ